MDGPHAPSASPPGREDAPVAPGLRTSVRWATWLYIAATALLAAWVTRWIFTGHRGIAVPIGLLMYAAALAATVRRVEPLPRAKFPLALVVVHAAIGAAAAAVGLFLPDEPLTPDGRVPKIVLVMIAGYFAVLLGPLPAFWLAFRARQARGYAVATLVGPALLGLFLLFEALRR